MKDRPIFYLKD